ncbi:Hypothetical predicted protein [Olea europaea subsp. europaea]|uniref:Uncharacterized protein n=1 Tax=Olea europaea subsp. europaea TaxID=158383 RepID=A0A8S0R6K8_OLEEU|nr:Hypothetical predicted protein [Olea europaea subsp. europaea]
MEGFRSKSLNDESLQIESYNPSNYDYTSHGVPSYKPNSNPPRLQDLRCYSASYASSSSAQNNAQMDIVPADQWKFKKVKSTNGAVSKNWSFNDPELQRKKRVASYKVYTVEGKVKGSIRKSFRWFKERMLQITQLQ